MEEVWWLAALGRWTRVGRNGSSRYGWRRNDCRQSRMLRGDGLVYRMLKRTIRDGLGCDGAGRLLKLGWLGEAVKAGR